MCATQQLKRLHDGLIDQASNLTVPLSFWSSRLKNYALRDFKFEYDDEAFTVSHTIAGRHPRADGADDYLGFRFFELPITKFKNRFKYGSPPKESGG